MNAPNVDPVANPADDFPDAAAALVRSTEGDRSAFLVWHLRVLLVKAACREGDPAQPGLHVHNKCRKSTGRRAAEALWEILDAVQFSGPASTEQVTASVRALHQALLDESALRKPRDR